MNLLHSYCKTCWSKMNDNGQCHCGTTIVLEPSEHFDYASLCQSEYESELYQQEISKWSIEVKPEKENKVIIKIDSLLEQRNIHFSFEPNKKWILHAEELKVVPSAVVMKVDELCCDMVVKKETDSFLKNEYVEILSMYCNAFEQHLKQEKIPFVCRFEGNKGHYQKEWKDDELPF